MAPLFIGLYGLFIILVGAKGNVNPLIVKLQQDMPGYLPWLLAIIVIAFLSQWETTEKVVKPFVFLLMITFFLRNFASIKTQISGIYNSALSK